MPHKRAPFDHQRKSEAKVEPLGKGGKGGDILILFPKGIALVFPAEKLQRFLFQTDKGYFVKGVL